MYNIVTNTEAVSPTWIVPFVKILSSFFYDIEIVEKYSVENVALYSA